MLTFSRGIEGEHVQLDPRLLFHELTQIVRQTFPKNIQIQARIPQEIWRVKGDSTQLHRVFLNLFLNARDAMPSGGTIRAELENIKLSTDELAFRPGLQPGSHVRIRVSDSGSGIDPRVIRKMDPNIRAIAMSGLSSDINESTLADRLEEAGMIRYLTKPFTAHNLLRSVHAALHQEA